jgi:hypothetical protein
MPTVEILIASCPGQGIHDYYTSSTVVNAHLLELATAPVGNPIRGFKWEFSKVIASGNCVMEGYINGASANWTVELVTSADHAACGILDSETEGSKTLRDGTYGLKVYSEAPSEYAEGAGTLSDVATCHDWVVASTPPEVTVEASIDGVIRSMPPPAGESSAHLDPTYFTKSVNRTIFRYCNSVVYSVLY